MTHPTTGRHFVATRSGRRHIREAGEGPALILLHQTPRSGDEYRDVLPLLAPRVRAIAMDTPGFGDSDPLTGGAATIERWAEAVLDLADALHLERFALAGHHTGAVVALETAARAPDRCARLVLSAMSFVDAGRRARHAGRRVIDEVEVRSDGGHLAELWERRRPFYPPEAADDLLSRFVRDALAAGPMAVAGHRIVNDYRMEERIGRVRCPTLILAPEADPHTFGDRERLRAAIPGSDLVTVPGATVPFPDHMPRVFAAAVRDFLDRHGAWT